jgi:hypothetical protein
MIIFEKFGDGQAERRRNVPVFSDLPMGSFIPLPLTVPLTVLVMQRSTERNLSHLSQGLSPSILAAASAALNRGGTSASLRGETIAANRMRLAFSNRELELLERRLSCCKQTLTTGSNRELCTIRSFLVPSRLMRDHVAVLRRGTHVASPESCMPMTSLPGTAQYVEYGVTPTKQTIATFLPGSRFAHSAGRKLNGEGRKYFAKASSSQALSGHGARLWTQSGARYNAYTNHNEITSFRSER